MHKLRLWPRFIWFHQDISQLWLQYGFLWSSHWLHMAACLDSDQTTDSLSICLYVCVCVFVCRCLCLCLWPCLSFCLSLLLSLFRSLALALASIHLPIYHRYPFRWSPKRHMLSYEIVTIMISSIKTYIKIIVRTHDEIYTRWTLWCLSLFGKGQFIWIGILSTTFHNILRRVYEQLHVLKSHGSCFLKYYGLDIFDKQKRISIAIYIRINFLAKF